MAIPSNDTIIQALGRQNKQTVLPPKQSLLKNVKTGISSSVVDFGKTVLKGAKRVIGGEVSKQEAKDVAGKTFKATTDLAGEIIKSPLRFATEATLSLRKGPKEEIVFNDLFGPTAGPIISAVYGRDKAQPFQPKIEAIKKDLIPLGATPTEQKFVPPILIGIGGLLDFYAKPVKGVFEKIAKETSEDVIKNVLKKEIKNLPNNVVDTWAKDLSGISNVKDVESYIKDQTKKIGEYTATKTITSQTPNLETPPPGIRPQEIPQTTTQNKIRIPTEQEILSQIPNQPAVRTVEPYTQAYTKPSNLAIEATAKQVGDDPSVVRRVADSLQKTKTDVIEYVQNSEERIRKLVSQPDVKVSEVSDPYLKATLYHGRVGSKMEAAKNEVKDIILDLKKSNIKREDVSDFLVARHAPERNLALGDGAAGIMTKEAGARLAELESTAQGAKIKSIADKIQQLNNKTLDLLQESGVITKELYKTLRQTYKTHVPLNRIMEGSDDVGGILAGAGFDVKSTGLFKAKGSKRKVSDILDNVVYNYEQAVLRSEKNIVDNATLAFIKNNKDILGDAFEIIKPKAIGKSFDGKILMQQAPNNPQILQMFEDGKKVWVKIKDPQLALALRGVDRNKLGGLMNVIGGFTRFYAGLATRFNPEFALPNKIRDLQEIAVYLASQKDVGFRGATKTVLKDPQSMGDILSYLRGKDTAGAKLYKEMKDLGGTTGGMGLSTKKQIELNINKIEQLAESKTKNIANNLIEYVDNWNTLFEDSTRLSVYKQAIQQGLSKERAAFLAKEASINFNRMGRGGPVINALYMFSNASIQGSAKMLRAMKNPKVLGATLLTVGGAVAATNEWNDSVDPNWRDSVTKWDRLNGLPLMLPSENGDTHYITIPVSWGLKPIKVMTDYAYDALSGQDFNTKDMMSDTLGAIIESYNPVGGTDLLSALTPTILDTPSEISRNIKWSGGKIKPDFDPNAPKDIQYFQSLRDTFLGRKAISLSEVLQEKGNIAVSPADIKYAYDQLVGGAGRLVNKVTDVTQGVITGNLPPIDEFPMISRFYRKRTAEEVGAGATTGESVTIKNKLGEQSRERFKVKSKAEQTYEELKKMDPIEANKKALELKKKEPEVYKKLTEIFKDEKLGLTYTERLMKQLGVENGERAEYVYEQIKKLPKDKRNSYYESLKNKKIISKAVEKQLRDLLKK